MNKLIQIYSAEGCVKCEQAAAYLTNLGIDFVKVDIYNDAAAMGAMRRDGLRSVPQIYQNDCIFVHGGFLGLSQMTKEDILNKLSGAKNELA